MASTNSLQRLDISHSGFNGATKIRFGVNVLSSGTIELDTGLSRIEAFFACGVNNTATEVLTLEIKEDLPTSIGTVTVDGTKVDEGGATADGGSSTFCWFAIGK